MGKPLRICILAFYFAPMVGGAELQAEKYARQLQELGHEITILTLRCEKDWPRQENYHGLHIIRIGGIYNRKGMLRIGKLGHFPIDMLTFQKLWQLSAHYDVIHVQQVSSLAGVAVLIGKMKKKPVFIRIASAGPGKEQHKAEATLMVDTLAEKQCDTRFLEIPYTDMLVGDFKYLEETTIGGKAIHDYIRRSEAYYHVLSTRCQAYLIAQGFRADKIVTIPNGIDTDQFCPDPSVRPHCAQPERTMICVARLEFPKGIDVLLHAWGRMMHAPAAWRTHLTPKLLLVGSGTLQIQLERMAMELGIQDSVEFLGLRRDIIPLLQRAWGFVLPSRWEGMPNALLEAMSCGVPVISTCVSGSEDIVQDGVNGLLVEPEQPAHMAEALKRLIEDTELAQRLAQEGRATIVREYQLAHIVQHSQGIYEHVLQQYQRRTLLVAAGIGEE